MDMWRKWFTLEGRRRPGDVLNDSGRCRPSWKTSKITNCNCQSYLNSDRNLIIHWAWIWSVMFLICPTPSVEADRTDHGGKHVHVTVVRVGESVTLPCDVHTKICGEAHSIKWYKNEHRVYVYSEMAKVDLAEGDTAAAGPRVTFIANATPPYFHIQWAELSDEAHYRCEVTYLRVQDSCPTITIHNLTVLDPPSPPEVHLNEVLLRNGSKLGARLEGDLINVSCASRGGKPAPQLSWWLGHQELTSSDHKRHYFIQKDVILQEDQRWTVLSSLEFTVSRDHLMNSRLECRVYHDTLDLPYYTWYQLDVRVRPSSMELLGPRQPVTAGTQVIMSCNVEGAKPAANVTWINGTSSRLRILPKEDITLSDFNTYRTESRLVFNVTRFEHLANITCRATNSVLRQKNESPMEQSIFLEVLYPPIPWIIPEGNVTVKEQESVMLTCDFIANPPNLTRVVWLKGNEPLVLGANHGTVNDIESGQPQLLIRNVTLTDQGEYRCTLENLAGPGTSLGRSNLGIQHPPEVIIHIIPAVVNETSHVKVRLRCDIFRANPHTLDRVKWYMDGKLLNETTASEIVLESVNRHHHGDYSCKAHNIAGWGVVSQAKHLVVNCKCPWTVLPDLQPKNCSQTGKFVTIVHSG